MHINGVLGSYVGLEHDNSFVILSSIKAGELFEYMYLV